VVRYDCGRAVAVIPLTTPVARGDVLAVWVSRGGRVAVPVTDMSVGGRPVAAAPAGAEVELPVPAPVRGGDRVFKTTDAALAAESAVSGGEEEIPLIMTVELAPGKPVRLTVDDGQGHEGTAESSVLAVKADKQPLTEEVLRRQLGRLGNTAYRLAHLAVQGPLDLMVPLSQLNILRRAALRDLERRAWGRREPVDYVKGFNRLLSREGRRAKNSRLPALAVAVTGLAALSAALDAGAARVYLSDELAAAPLSARDWREATGLCYRRGAELVPVTPRIAHDAEYPALERMLGWIRDLGLTTVLAGNAGPLSLARECGLGVWGDFTLPAFNSLALDFWRDRGVTGVTLSPELTLGQVKELARLSVLPLEGLVHGVLPLMVSAHCPLGARAGAGGRADCPGPCGAGRWRLEDRKGELFDLVPDRMCRMHLFNGRDLSMYAHLPELTGAGLSLWRIEARARDASYVGTVTAVYRSALDRLAAGQNPVRAEEQARLFALSPAGLTGAHYYRGVL